MIFRFSGSRFNHSYRNKSMNPDFNKRKRILKMKLNFKINKTQNRNFLSFRFTFPKLFKFGLFWPRSEIAANRSIREYGFYATTLFTSLHRARSLPSIPSFLWNESLAYELLVAAHRGNLRGVCAINVHVNNQGVQREERLKIPNHELISAPSCTLMHHEHKGIYKNTEWRVEVTNNSKYVMDTCLSHHGNIQGDTAKGYCKKYPDNT